MVILVIMVLVVVLVIPVSMVVGVIPVSMVVAVILVSVIVVVIMIILVKGNTQEVMSLGSIIDSVCKCRNASTVQTTLDRHFGQH